MQSGGGSGARGGSGGGRPDGGRSGQRQQAEPVVVVPLGMRKWKAGGSMADE